MATVTLYPTGNATTATIAGTVNSFPNSATGLNAADSVFAQIAIGIKNTNATITTASAFGFGGVIPAGAVVSQVDIQTLTQNVATSQGTQFVAVVVGGTVGVEQSNTGSTTATARTFLDVRKGDGTVPTRADLLDGTFAVRVRALQPNNTTGTTYGWDYVRVVVNWAVFTQTQIAQVSLGPALTPVSRTGHAIKVRARVQSGTGILYVAVFEGAVNRTPGIWADMTTSLADYTVPIADTDAATITDYSNLTLAFQGYNTAAINNVFEVAEISLLLPAAASSDIKKTGSLFAGASPKGPEQYTAVVAGSLLAGAKPSGVPVKTAASNNVYQKQSVSVRGLFATAADAVSSVETGASLRDDIAAGVSSQAHLPIKTVTSVKSHAAKGARTGGNTSSGNLAYVSGGHGLPDLAVQIAFASNPTDSTQTWVDVTKYVRSVGIRRGRNDELTRVEAGTLDLLLDNRDSRFNPENTSGPYYPNVLPKKAVRVVFRSGVTETPAFYGFTSGFPQSWPHLGKDSVVQLQATDMMGLLARAKFSPPLPISLRSNLNDISVTVATSSLGDAFWPTDFPYTVSIGGEDMSVTSSNPAGPTLTVTRGFNNTVAATHSAGDLVTTNVVNLGSSLLSGDMIMNALANALWRNVSYPAGYFANVASGLTTLTSGNVGVDTSPLEFILTCADSEAGLFFAGTDGRPVFHDRHFRIAAVSPTAVFGDAGGSELQYTDIGVSDDETQLYNTVVVTASGGQKVTATDNASAQKYWPQTLERQTIGGGGNAQDLAYYLLSRFKNPQLRIPTISLDGHKVPGATLTNLDLDQQYTVVRRPAVGTAITRDAFVENVNHAITPGHWATSLSLSPADQSDFWVLGTSRLGIDTKLAY